MTPTPFGRPIRATAFLRVSQRRRAFGLALAAALLTLPAARGAEAYVPFDGEKSAWHDGFDRFDYQMNVATLQITPFKPAEGEKFGVKEPAPGQRRCLVIAPKEPALGQPWSWRGCYWDHEPQTEVELLHRGYHIAYISANSDLKPGPEWDAWYAFLTAQHGLSPKPGFIGMSRGGEYSYTWASAHPGSVSCIYADNPGGNAQIFARLADLARNDVPLLQVCGSFDPLFGRVASVIETSYLGYGGRVTTMIKEGAGHHPHSLRDPSVIADWIEQNTKPFDEPSPAWLGARVTRTSYYGIANSYRDFPKQGGSITCRGAAFSPCYHRYQFDLPGVEGSINVIEPAQAAAGRPWVFRADFVDRDASVDQELLERGFHIVTGPVPYNADGPSLTSWNATYRHFTSHGFSARPVLEGRGGAAGEAYAWALQNPEQAGCVYGENPILRSKMWKVPLLDHLPPLAKAGVPLIHVCGSLDPAFADSTGALEKRYRELGGQIVTIVKDGAGHYPLSPTDPQAVADLIVKSLH